MFAYDPLPVAVLWGTDESGVTVREFHRTILIDIFERSGFDTPAVLVSAAEPALVITHAMIDHLRMDLQQIKVEQRGMVFTACDLGFHAIAQPSPIEMVGPFTEEWTLMRVPLKLEQLRVVLDFRQRHRRHWLSGFVIQLMPGRHAGVHIQIRSRRVIATMDLGRVVFREPERTIALESIALHTRSGVEPGGRGRAVTAENAGRRVIARGIRVEVDVIFVDRPDVAALVSYFAEPFHPFVATIVRIGRQVIRQLHIISRTLPDMLNDGHVIDSQVFQLLQVLGVAGERIAMMSPDVEHDARSKRRQVGRWIVRNVRQDLGQLGRHGHIPRLEQWIALARGCGVIHSIILRTLR